MNYKQLMKQIKDKKIGLIYLFYGEEELLSKMMLDHIKDALIDPTLSQMNINQLDGKTVYIDEIINACETLPFMSDKRLVVIKDSTMFNSSSTHISTKDVDILCKYLEELPESTHIIFINRVIDKKKKLYKLIQKIGEIVEYNKLQKSDLTKWINKRISLHGKKVVPEATNLFIEYSDYLNKDSKKTLSDIENEIHKLIAYSKDVDVICEQEVGCVVQDNMDTNIFKLLELIGKGAAGESIKLLDILLQGGEPPIKILYMLIRQFRFIYHSRILKDAGFSNGDIPKLMSERPFIVSKALEQGRYYSQEQLSQAYQFLTDIDSKMKKGQIEHRLALELLIFKFA